MKTIMICFDGTSNHPSDASQEREWFGAGDYEDNGITNILKLHCLFGGTLDNEPNPKVGTRRNFYYSGVGTYGGRVQKLFNAGFALENLDVRDIINAAGRDLKNTYVVGDEILLFGFSRGAAIARRFATVIDQYITVAPGSQPVRFLGVFDTVASIGAPNLSRGEQPVSDVVFENCKVSPHVREALHLVSVDENRLAFRPTLMNKEPRVTEIWFPGAHSDVGGGFWFDGLSDVALNFMIGEIGRRLSMKPLTLADLDWDKLVARDGTYRIDKEDIEIKPLIDGKAHPKDRWWPVAQTTLAPRTIRVIVDDNDAAGELPVVHVSVRERFCKVTDYRPRALKGIKHFLIDDMLNRVDQAVFDGLVNYEPPPAQAAIGG